MEPMSEAELLTDVQLPRVTIRFCTQCKWMLRAAYFAQELLSTFSTSLGEVSLMPAIGGVFTVDITHALAQDHEVANGQRPTIQTLRLWDRKAEGGFPEVKKLKQLVRNVVDPNRDLGHVDRSHDGKGSGSVSDEKSYSMVTGQLSTKEPERYTIQEQTARLGTYTTVEGPAGSEENRNDETRKQKVPRVLEACEECE
ncbi:Rdx family-domain-containing protein [Usnea florida]